MNGTLKQKLETVIAKNDCKLFYDYGINEYFIYKWNDDSPPLAHDRDLEKTVDMALEELYNE